MWWKIGLCPGSPLVYFGTYNQVLKKKFMKEYISPDCLPSGNGANNVYLLVGFFARISEYRLRHALGLCSCQNYLNLIFG